MRGRRAGLTLMELLIALTLTTVVVSAVYSILRSAYDSRRRGEATADLLQIARITQGRIVEDLESAVTVSEDANYVFTGTDAVEDDFDADTLEFACLSGDPQDPYRVQADLCRVQYYVDLDERTPEEGLIRVALPQPVPEDLRDEEVEAATRELGRLVVGLDVAYYDPTEDEWLPEWQEREGLPGAVRVALVLRDPLYEGETRRFETIVRPRLADVDLAAARSQGIGTEPGVAAQEQPERAEEEQTPTMPLLPGGGSFPSPSVEGGR